MGLSRWFHRRKLAAELTLYCRGCKGLVRLEEEVRRQVLVLRETVPCPVCGTAVGERAW